MSNNKLYQQLAQATQHESMDFDQGAMWTAIESEMDNKRKSYGFIFLLFGAVISIGLLGLWFVNNKNSATQSSESNKISTHSKASIATEINPQHSDQTILAASTFDSNEEEKETNVVHPSNKENQANSTIANTKTSKNNNISPQQTNQSSQSLSTSSATTSGSLKNDISSNKNPLPLNHVSAQNSVPSNLQDKRATTGSNTPSNNNTLPSVNQDKTDETINDKINIRTSSSTNTQDQVVSANENAIKRNLINQLNNKSISLFPINQSELSYQPLANKRDWSRCEINQPWSILVEAYGGFGYPLMKHELKDPNESSNYLNEWEDAQSPVGGFQAGAALVIQSPGGFEFTGGFEYQHVVQKLESQSTTSTTKTIWNPMAYFIIDVNGTKVWFADSTTSTVITTEKRVNEIRHRLMNIPIKIGYVAPIGDWNIGAHGGVILHLSHVVKGTILQPNGSYIEIDKNNSQLVYKTDLGLSYTADIHIGRQVTDNLELFIRPEFRYHTDSWTSVTRPINTKIQLAQMQVGLRYVIK